MFKAAWSPTLKIVLFKFNQIDEACIPKTKMVSNDDQDQAFLKTSSRKKIIEDDDDDDETKNPFIPDSQDPNIMVNPTDNPQENLNKKSDASEKGVLSGYEQQALKKDCIRPKDVNQDLKNEKDNDNHQKEPTGMKRNLSDFSYNQILNDPKK